MQHDLFRDKPANLELTPSPGRAEPRLWVKRLVIWRDKGDCLRDVPLRPGLNVVWSPDAAADGVSIGHGGGKTTFCRLLRYCLGEDSFAPAGQRRATFDKMPTGRVGAEVRLDGQTWAIVRGFTPFNEDWAIPNATLELALEAIPPTGIDPFRAAATEALLGGAAQLMPKPIGPASAWPAVLAWLTRDQECRFSHLLDWRDRESDSHSPVRGRSVEDRLRIVRAVLGILTEGELAMEARRDALAEAASKLRTMLGRLEWQAERSHRALAKELGVEAGQSPTDLDAQAFSKAAEEKLAAAIGLEKPTRYGDDLQKARAEHDRLQAVEREADLALQGRNIEIAERAKYSNALRDELPQLSAGAAKVPVCSACREPIGTMHTCSAPTQGSEYERKLQTYRNEEAKLLELRQSVGTLQHRLAVARQNLQQHRAVVDKLVSATLDQAAGLRRAQQLVADATRQKQLFLEKKREAGELERIEAERERLKDALGQQRAAAGELIRQLSDRCDAVARHLLPGDVTARTVLDGNGLQLRLEMGGDRSTAALESLKVVVFDLAVLTFAIEGKTCFPGFLVHDSPREADLDLLVYHRLFGFIEGIEGVGPNQLFQYIITTTTAPPANILDSEALCLRLRGAPASERLFRLDL